MASFQSVGSDTKKTGGYVAAVPKKIKPKTNENSAMLMKAMLLGQRIMNQTSITISEELTTILRKSVIIRQMTNFLSIKIR